MQTTTSIVRLCLLATCSSQLALTADNATEANFVNKTSASPGQRPPSSAWSSYVSGSVAQAFTITAITITVVGTIANGYVLLALILTKNSSKNNVNIFIMHQTILDLTASVFHFIGMMVTTVGAAIGGTLGNIVCLLFQTYTISISASHASVCGLVIITIERYVKIVHPVAHRNKYRSWMTRAGIIIPWNSLVVHDEDVDVVLAGVLRAGIIIPWIFGICLEFIPAATLSRIVRGRCTHLNAEWKTAHEVIRFLLLYAVPLAVLVFAYWKILAVVRRKRKQVGQQAGTSTSNAETVAEKNSRRTEMNVVKAMLLVSATFAVCYFPMRLYTVLTQLEAVPALPSLFFLFAVFHYLSQCINPFIYATQYDVVRGWWRARACRELCGHKEEATTVHAGPALQDSGQRHQTTTKHM